MGRLIQLLYSLFSIFIKLLCPSIILSKIPYLDSHRELQVTASYHYIAEMMLFLDAYYTKVIRELGAYFPIVLQEISRT
jgi:hypothetical protein